MLTEIHPSDSRVAVAPMATINAEKPCGNNPTPVNLDDKALDLSIHPSNANSDSDPSSRNPSDSSSALNPPSSNDVSANESNKNVGSESNKTTAATLGSATGIDDQPSAVEKKMRRAERFGINVQLTEQEKRNSRAERFGIGSPSETSKASEDLKRKARAERFGTPAPSIAADEDAKKKARLARFGAASETDLLGEDKRKARALRFSNPVSNAVSAVNGKGKMGTKAAISGKAGGEA